MFYHKELNVKKSILMNNRESCFNKRKRQRTTAGTWTEIAPVKFQKSESGRYYSRFSLNTSFNFFYMFILETKSRFLKRVSVLLKRSFNLTDRREEIHGSNT